MAEKLKEKGQSALRCLGGFWQDENGQDLIEYTLLIAFVALSSAALFNTTGSSVSKVWSTSNSTLSRAAVIAAS
ncbi:MAG: Flp family type IVb pilin [Bryobacteraceae bacterium]